MAIIPKSIREAKDLLLPGVYTRYRDGRDFDVFVRDERDVMLNDGSGVHVIISEPELKEGWYDLVKERIKAIQLRSALNAHDCWRR